MDMSVTRALVELKTIGDRIVRSINEGQFVAPTQGLDSRKRIANSSVSIADATKTIEASYARINSLISRRQTIKSEIVKSNAVTKVKIGGKVMTVAEAIEMKQSILSKEHFLNSMRVQLREASTTVSSLNIKLDTQIEQALVAIYGSDKSKITADLQETVSKPKRQEFQAELLDPLKLADVIETLRQEIETFKGEVDFTLSESNARTMVNIPD